MQLQIQEVIYSWEYKQQTWKNCGLHVLRNQLL